MTIETYKYYCDVVKSKSFSKAAEVNNVNQSTVSQAVQSLEKNYNCILIDRSKRPWEITKEGEFCYNYLSDILTRINDLNVLLKNTNKVNNQKLWISAIYSVGLNTMYKHLEYFKSIEPDIDIKLMYQHPDKVYESVLTGQADLGIVSYPKKDKDYDIIPWLNEEMVCVVYPEHPLAKNKEIELKHLNNEEFIGFDTGLKIHEEIDNLLNKNLIKVNIKLEFDNIESIKAAIEAGYGIAILPETTVKREVKSGTLKIIKLTGADFYRPLSIIQKAGSMPKDAVKKFITRLLDYN